MDRGTNRQNQQALLVAVIVLSTALIAVLDFVTSAELVGSILFTLPLSLSALQGSKKLLWSTAATAVILTLAADRWGFGQRAALDLHSALVNRGLLVATLVTLAWFIHLRINLRAHMIGDARTIAQQTAELAAQNAQLEQLAKDSADELSARVAAADHLVQMERRYRGLLEAAPDSMVVVDERGNIVLANLQAKKQFGYSRGEVIGHPVTMLIPQGFAERLIADGTRTAAEALAQQIGTGIRLVAVRKDGTRFPIEIMLSPLASDDGMLVTVAIRDISVWTTNMAKIAEMEGKYRALLERSPDALMLVTSTGELLLASLEAERQFGYGREELLGQSIARLLPEGAMERLIGDALGCALPGAKESMHAVTGLVGRRKNGASFPIEAMAAPLQRDDGQTLVTVSIRDITKRVQGEARLMRAMVELERSNEELEQFAYIASHDLQEPLRMVASFTQLLAKRYRGKLDADADEFIGYAVDGADRMQRLIQDLLAYSRIGTKGKELDATSSANALDRALVNLQGATVASGAVITHDTLPMVLADDRQLTQLFQNLIGNAIKYQDPGVVPKIHIAIERDANDRQQFSIRDNGIGVDPKYFVKIFGMFQRLHKRTEFAGTGIGLAICKKIVERHGGKISVESSVGHGSTFHFGLAASERTS
jgi:PAS domain S-box-containing protein